MDDKTMQRMRKHITDNEDKIPTPYKDNKGKLTVGIGFKVDDVKSFVAMPFEITDPKTGELRPATEAEKNAEFQRAKGLSNDELRKGPSKSPLSLPKVEIERRLDSEITSRIDKIKGEIGTANWDRLTSGQQTAVLDVHYANGSLSNYPKLKEGIETGDAKKIGENVDFHSGGARNWERLARNRAEAQGISFEEATRQVEADRKAGKFDLPVKPQQGDLSTLRPEPRPQDWPEKQSAPEPSAEPQAGLLDTVPQTGGLANEAAETQAAADQVRGEDAKEQTANIDSRIASMREMAAQPIDHPGKSALLKPVGVWTETEMKDVLNSAQGDFTGWRSGDPLKARMYETVQDWHTNTYGDGPQLVEGGKPVEPLPLGITPINPSAHTTPQGEDLWKASARMGDKIGTIAETVGYEQSVKGLQRGLNILNSTLPLPDRSEAWGPYTPQEALKVDGDYGPKTDFALKDTLARHGMPKAEDALALGRFGTFADQVKQSGKAEGLDQAARDIFGPLYGGSEAPNGVLQETLNKVGGDSIDNWQDLKVDDWIGPKTTDAFAQVMDQTDPEDFTRSFGQGLGLL